MKIKFLRRNTNDYSRLGKKRKKLQKWRSPNGRDNKMRLRRKGYPRTVEIGYKQDSKTRGKIEGMEVFRVNNLSDIDKVEKNQIIIIGRMSKRKREDITKKCNEKGIKIANPTKEEKTKEKNK